MAQKLIMTHLVRPAGRGGESTTTVKTAIAIVEEGIADKVLASLASENKDEKRTFVVNTTIPVYATMDDFLKRNVEDRKTAIYSKLSPDELRLIGQNELADKVAAERAEKAAAKAKAKAEKAAKKAAEAKATPTAAEPAKA